MGGSSSANRFLVCGVAVALRGALADRLVELSTNARRIQGLAATVFLGPVALKSFHGLIHPFCIAGAFQDGLGREVFVLCSGVVSLAA